MSYSYGSKKNGWDDFAGCIGLIVMAIAIVVLGSLVNGFVVMKVWNWFILPLGLPPIGIANAIGIALFFSLFTNKKDDTDTDGKSPGYLMVYALIRMFGWALITLLMGWVVFQFMPM